jgi:hypothetical protein
VSTNVYTFSDKGGRKPRALHGRGSVDQRRLQCYAHHGLRDDESLLWYNRLYQSWCKEVIVLNPPVETIVAGTSKARREFARLYDVASKGTPVTIVAGERQVTRGFVNRCVNAQAATS